ncbi:hypothetical protein FLL45_12205 [Aliikangiella marina]|uniref:Thioredoxin-like fold domain-containing protein n=1 Tax=Aliikangiella marina TaxID=1712262 RepID=A0A545T8T2_9GAMM|nr:hypothetical protein [Aliikangiella marina]TQV73630.1 hypothetical protein FLL45_12205 [Aliikangiella marina]
MAKLKLTEFVLLLAIFSWGLLPSKSYGQESSATFVEGIDYFAVQSSQADVEVDLTALEAVADIEVFYWYGCYACWQVERKLSDYLATRTQLRVVRTPLVAHTHWREQAYLQPLMEQLADTVELPTTLDIYQACLEDCSVFNSYESGRDWLFAQANVTEQPLIDEAAIWAAEKSYRNRAESFSISQVPTIIINEAFVVTANSAKSADRMLQIIDYLLTR